VLERLEVTDRLSALDQDQRQLQQHLRAHHYSFIVTNLEVSTPAAAAAVEYWYHRHRAEIENIVRDAKHGGAQRHLPSDIPRSTPGGCGVRYSRPVSLADSTYSPPPPDPTATWPGTASATAKPWSPRCGIG